MVEQTEVCDTLKIRSCLANEVSLWGRCGSSEVQTQASVASGRGAFEARVASPTVKQGQLWKTLKMAKKEKKKKKKTALVICRDRKEFWTTQKQFWQWAREGVIDKTGDQPLTGAFRREHDELMVLVSNTVLNLARPNHMREALLSRRLGLGGK